MGAGHESRFPLGSLGKSGQPGGIPLETETTQEREGHKGRDPEGWPKNIWELGDRVPR